MSRTCVENPPSIADDVLERIRLVPKSTDDGEWRDSLRPRTVRGAYRFGTFALPTAIDFGPARGTIRLFSRQTIDKADNWTVGLAFIDLQGNEYRVVRCNGLHGPHRNHLEGERIQAKIRHIHYATERYLKSKHLHDTYAEITDAYVGMGDAMTYLASLVNLTTTASML